MTVSRLHAWFLYPLFFLSGGAALGYQVIWARQFVAGLGHEVPALVSIAAAFLGGTALGAALLDRRISRSPVPGRWYAALEMGIGVTAAVATLTIPLVNEVSLRLIGPESGGLRQWVVVFALPFVTLLPATLAMGATVPAMDRFLAPLLPDRRGVGAFYAANTFGAAVGTLGAVFLLTPALGFRTSGLVLACVNAACGIAALLLSRHAGEEASVVHQENAAFTRSRLRLALFFTGLLGVGYELVGVRVLSLVFENTIFTFAVVLAVYLAGITAGATLYQKVGRRFESRALLAVLLGLLSGACLAGVWCLGHAIAVHDRALSILGGSIGGTLLAEAAVALLIFGPPALLMGATFSHLAQNARREGGGVGRAVAWNTLGCALAGLTFVVLALSRLGAKWTLCSIALGYLALLPTLRGRAWVGLVLPVTMLFVLPRELKLLRLAPDERVLDYREGVMASVAVIGSADGHRSLRVNNRLQMGGTGAAIAERRQAHLPLLLHPSPRHALFLGPGTGITLGAATVYPDLESDAVELLPEVAGVMRAFEPENNGPFPTVHARVIVADARRFVRTTTNRYDVIVGDVFHPAVDGAGFLYTREHFDAVKRRLLPGGLFCQWLPLHQFDEATLRIIARTFTEVFPHAYALLLHFNVDIPVLGLAGSLEPLRLTPDWIERRDASPDLRRAWKGVNLDRTINLVGCLAADGDSLRQFARGALVNTDDAPAVTFLAPRAAQGATRPSSGLLLNLVQRFRPVLDHVVDASGSTNGAAFLANSRDWIAARDLYLQGLSREAAGDLQSAIDLYLQSTARSLHFTPAYARCVTIIQAMAGGDTPGARRLFERLESVRPDQPLGRQLLGPLFESKAK